MRRFAVLIVFLVGCGPAHPVPGPRYAEFACGISFFTDGTTVYSATGEVVPEGTYSAPRCEYAVKKGQVIVLGYPYSS